MSPEELCRRIVIVLDESGSMSSQRVDMIGSLNNMIAQQRAVDPTHNHEVKLDIIKFSTTVGQPKSSTLADFQDFTPEDYKPAGSTALFDAIGTTLERYSDERRVLVVVVTDGKENMSRKYTSFKDISEMVDKFTNEKEWNFMYLSENIDTFQQGADCGYGGKVSSINHSLRTTSTGYTCVSSGKSNTVCTNVCTTLGGSAYNEKMANFRLGKVPAGDDPVDTQTASLRRRKKLGRDSTVEETSDEGIPLDRHGCNLL